MSDDPLAELASHGIVPVVVLDDAGDAGGLAEALVAGGLPVAEVTLRTSSAVEAMAVMARRGDMLVGAGTVLTVQQVDEAVAAGAGFIVSPGLSEAVVRRCQEINVPVFPGAVTATEITRALELGLNTVKFFPSETSGGAAAIRALSAPFGDLKFVPTGGISQKNARDYLALDCVSAVGGSWMVPRDKVRAQQFDEITQLTRGAVALVNQTQEG